MAEKKQILFVDDSAILRRLLADALSSDPDIEITAPARPFIPAMVFSSSRPDLIVLDAEMPMLDVVAVVKEIRRTDERVPLLIFSPLTANAAEVTLRCLEAGATDFAVKPARSGHVSAAAEYMRSELVPKVRLFLLGDQESPASAPAPASAERRLPAHPAEVVAIGTSSGGPRALAELLSRIAPDYPVPILIVQHMPPLFTEILAASLSQQCSRFIGEGREGEVLAAGQIWLAPGDHHMHVDRMGAKTVLRLSQEAPEHACRPAIDVLFRSVAKAYGPAALGIVLTGMGHDGLLGATTIRQAGGQIVVQGDAAAPLDGMPQAVIAAGIADRILPLSAMAEDLHRSVLQ